MIPTYTNTIKENIITNYLGANLVIALINHPLLGLTDTPTNNELELRKNFDILTIPNYEIGSVNLNGYSRYIIDNNIISPTVINSQLTEVELEASFTAIGGSLNPFTHIVAIRGANLDNVDSDLNGNNRGDINGTIIFIEPVNNTSNPGTPLIVEEGITFNYNFKLSSST